jgi:prolipoprotein diacylglyceryltransferase
MDYNYVRMRNAAHMGDRALTEHYRKLYEAGPPIKTYSVMLNYVIILLVVIAALLGAYIAFIIFKEESTVTAMLDIFRVWRCCLC